MFLNDIVTIYSSDSKQDRKKSSNYFDDDFIYLKQDNEILKLRLRFNHMDIVDAIEEYIQNDNIYDFEVLSENDVETKYNIGNHFFPFVGKYKMDGKLKKTNNYFVPRLTELLSLLIELYNNCNLIPPKIFASLITHNNFEKLYSIYNENKNTNNINILKELCSKVYVVLEERLDVDILRQQLDSTTNFIKNVDLETYKKLKLLLESANENQSKFTELGLDIKVKEALGLRTKEKQLKK